MMASLVAPPEREAIVAFRFVGGKADRQGGWPLGSRQADPGAIDLFAFVNDAAYPCAMDNGIDTDAMMLGSIVDDLKHDLEVQAKAMAVEMANAAYDQALARFNADRDGLVDSLVASAKPRVLALLDDAETQARISAVQSSFKKTLLISLAGTAVVTTAGTWWVLKKSPWRLQGLPTMRHVHDIFSALGASGTPYTGEYASSSANVGNYGDMATGCVTEQDGDASFCQSAKARADIMAAVDTQTAQLLAAVTGDDVVSQLTRDAISKAASCAKHNMFLDCAAKGYTDSGTSIPHHTPEGSGSGTGPIWNLSLLKDISFNTGGDKAGGATSGGSSPSAPDDGPSWGTIGLVAAGAAAAVWIGMSAMKGARRGLAVRLTRSTPKRYKRFRRDAGSDHATWHHELQHFKTRRQATAADEALLWADIEPYWPSCGCMYSCDDGPLDIEITADMNQVVDREREAFLG